MLLLEGVRLCFDRQMVGIRAVAEKLGMSESGVRKLILAKEIRYLQHGKRGRIRVDPTWIEDFIVKNSNPPVADGRKPAKKRKKPSDNRTASCFTPNQHGFSWELLR